MGPGQRISGKEFGFTVQGRVDDEGSGRWVWAGLRGLGIWAKRLGFDNWGLAEVFWIQRFGVKHLGLKGLG